MTFNEYHESFLFLVGEKMLGLDRASLANFIFKSGRCLDDLTTDMRVAAGMQHPATYFRAMMRGGIKISDHAAHQDAIQQARKKYGIEADAREGGQYPDRWVFHRPDGDEILIMKFGPEAGVVQRFRREKTA